MNPNNEPVNIPDFEKEKFPNTQNTQNVQNEIAKENVKEDLKRKQIPEDKVDYTTRGLVFAILSILLLMAVYFVYNYSQFFLETGIKSKEQTLVFENTLVRANKSRVISLEAGASKEAVRSIILQALLNERVNPGEISLVMPSYLRDTNVNGERKLVSELQRGDDFFFTFAPRSPLNLRVISGENYAIGVAGVGNLETDGPKNFLSFSVTSAAEATREMLNYEAQIYNDFKQVLKLRDIKGNFYFKDLSDNNHLLRVAYDDNGVVMVYGFGAPKTIIVAPDTLTFQTVYLNLK